MSPNGRRAWRKWCKRARLRMNKHHRALYRGAIMRKKQPERTPLPVKPFTARSLVGMTMGARKRAWLSNALYPVVFPSGIVTDETEMQAGYSWQEIRDDWPLLGERLRPCPGCCACWGHRISSAYGEIAECCGPQTSGKRKSQIKAMRKWQETLADNCDGSGVLPARGA